MRTVSLAVLCAIVLVLSGSGHLAAAPAHFTETWESYATGATPYGSWELEASAWGTLARPDADGLTQVDSKVDGGIVEICDRVSRVAIYVVAASPGERARVEARRQALVAAENAIGFDPGRNPADLAVLQEMVRTKPR